MKSGVLALIAGLLSTPAPAQQSMLTPVQQRVLAPYFKVQDILGPSLPDFRQGALTLIWSQKTRQMQLNLGFGKSILLPGQTLKRACYLILNHYSVDKGVHEPFKCKPGWQRQDISHPEFGKFIACAQAQKPAGSGLISAIIYPVWGNRKSHVDLSYFGLSTELSPLIQSLRSADSP